MTQTWWLAAIMIQETAARGAERMKAIRAPSLWFMAPPARQPMMLPMKNRLAIQEPRKRSICMGSSGVVPFIIFGIATLEKESQPPTIDAPKDTPMAASNWDKLVGHF